MKNLQRIDKFLILLFENISIKSQRWLGMDNFNLAYICLIPLVGLPFLSLNLDKQTTLNIFSDLYAKFVIIGALLFFVEIGKKVSSDPVPEYTHVLLLSVLRWFSLFMLIFGLILDFIPGIINSDRGEIIVGLRMLFFFCFVFFISCKHTPQVKTKWEELKEKLSASLSKIIIKTKNV